MTKNEFLDIVRTRENAISSIRYKLSHITSLRMELDIEIPSERTLRASLDSLFSVLVQKMSNHREDLIKFIIQNQESFDD